MDVSQPGMTFQQTQDFEVAGICHTGFTGSPRRECLRTGILRTWGDTIDPCQREFPFYSLISWSRSNSHIYFSWSHLNRGSVQIQCCLATAPFWVVCHCPGLSAARDSFSILHCPRFPRHYHAESLLVARICIELPLPRRLLSFWKCPGVDWCWHDWFLVCEQRCFRCVFATQVSWYQQARQFRHLRCFGGRPFIMSFLGQKEATHCRDIFVPTRQWILPLLAAVDIAMHLAFYRGPRLDHSGHFLQFSRLVFVIGLWSSDS